MGGMTDNLHYCSYEVCSQSGLLRAQSIYAAIHDNRLVKVFQGNRGTTSADFAAITQSSASLLTCLV